MNWFIQLYTNHPTVAPLVSYMLFSAAVGAMPAPLSGSGLFYIWLFKFLNTFASNFARAFSSKLGGGTNGSQSGGSVVPTISSLTK